MKMHKKVEIHTREKALQDCEWNLHMINLIILRKILKTKFFLPEKSCEITVEYHKDVFY